MSTYTIDGSEALADQENDLNGIELANFVKVTNYTKSANTKNEATVADAPPGIKRLYLAMVDAGAATSTVIQQQKGQGRDLIFSGTAYVSSAEKTVMGFRQT